MSGSTKTLVQVCETDAFLFTGDFVWVLPREGDVVEAHVLHPLAGGEGFSVVLAGYLEPGQPWVVGELPECGAVGKVTTVRGHTAMVVMSL